MIASKQIAFGKAAGAKKPYDAEIEFIGFTGTQKIILPYSKTSLFNTELTIKHDQTSQRTFVLSRSSDRGEYFDKNANGLYSLGSTSVLNGVSSETKQTINFSVGASSSTLSCGNNSVTRERTVNGIDDNWVIGAAYMALNYGVCLFGNLYKADFYSDDGNIRLIPVRKGNVGYMYDRVSGQLFGNAGMGEFVLGKDVGGDIEYTAKDYVQDGLVAMWDGIENAGWGVHDPSATVWKDLVGTNDMVFNQSFTYDIDDDSVLFHDNNKAGERAQSQMSVTMTNDMTIEGMMFVPDTLPVWDVRMCVGLLNSYKTGVFPFARGEYYNTPALKYTASYSDATDRYFGSPTRGETTSSTVVFKRADKSFGGYYNGAFISSIGSQEDNWLGDDRILKPTFIYKQLSDSVIGSDIRIHYMRIYSRALTAEEIAHNYEIDKARFGL